MAVLVDNGEPVEFGQPLFKSSNQLRIEHAARVQKPALPLLVPESGPQRDLPAGPSLERKTLPPCSKGS